MIRKACWSYMRELMLTNADDSPVVVTLDELFHLL